MNSLRFLQQVHPQILDAIAWYELQADGLGDSFVEDLDRTLMRLREQPRMYPVAYRATRRALLQRFPYKIYYRVDKDVVTVVAVLHHKRKPRH